MTGLVLDTDLTNLQRDYVETIRNGGDLLMAVVNDILDFSKIESGKLTLEVLEFDLLSTIEDECDMFVVEAFKKIVGACVSY